MDNKFGKGKVSDDLVKIVNGILEEEANHTHEVYNSKNMNVVGRYKNAEAARKAADKFDNKYGAYVHRVRPLKEDSEQIDEISHETLNKYQAKAMQSFSKDRFSSDKKVADKAIKHGKGATKAVKKMAAKNIPDKADRGYGQGRYMGDSVEVDGKLIEASGTVNAQVAPADQSSTIDVDQQKRKKKLTELYKSTVHSYKAKAEKDSDKHEKDLDSGIRSGHADKANKAADKLNRRAVGLNRADDRLNKEEFVQEGAADDMKKAAYNAGHKHAMAGKDYDKTDMKKEWGPHFKHFESGHMNGILDRKTQKNEDVEQIDEVLGSDATISDWIHDFIHSKNPKFAGKSKEERRNQAIAAFYAKKHEVKEERSAEDKKKDELWAAAKKRVEGGQKQKSSAEERSGKARAGEYDWGTKKEEVEPITELKKTTIASYLKKKVKKMDDDKENFSKHNKDQKGLTSGLKRMLGKAPVSEDKNPEMDAGVGSDGQFVTNANTTSEPAPIKKKS